MDEFPASNPLEDVFEQAVQPFASAAELSTSFAEGSVVVVMRKPADAPVEGEGEGAQPSVNVPVLGALMESAEAERHRASAYDFSLLKGDEIAVVYDDISVPDPALRVVTRASDGAFLSADIGAMLEGLGKAADHPAFKVFPGSEFLVEALQQGLKEAKKHLVESFREEERKARAGGAKKRPTEP